MNLTIGQILKPQGIRGELKVKPFTDSAEIFYEIKRVFLDEREYKIVRVRTDGEFAYLALRGVADRNAAELLRGKELAIPREEAPEPESGSYYIADVLGSEVVTEEGERLGTLTDIRQAATDVYTLDMDGKETLFPACRGVVLRVDTHNKTITVDKKRFLEVAVL